MNLKAVLDHFKQELKPLYPESEILCLFYMVVEQLTGWKRAAANAYSEQQLSTELSLAFQSAVKQIGQGIPLQYVLGEADFYQLKFKVDSSVLIPRPETEELVDWIITLLKQDIDPSTLQILDIGTGSGCIAIALKHNLPSIRVFALDVSEQALQTASVNAVANQTAINFIKADIRNYSSPEQFDVIVSNPPYITDSEKEDMHQNVLSHEPHLALFVADLNPLEFYEAIADYALTALRPEGKLFFEINGAYGAEMVELLSIKSFKSIELRKDMQGVDRMICCNVN